MINSRYLDMVLKIVQSDRLMLNKIMLLMLISSIIDFLGLSLIAPFVLYLIKSENNFSNVFGYNLETNTVLILLGSTILLTYSLKALVSIYLQKRIINFSNEQLYKIRSRLMHNLMTERYTTLNRENTNELIYDIQTLTATFCGKVLTLGLRFASDLIICCAIIFALAYQNFFVFFLLLSITIVFILVYDRLVSRKITSYGKIVNVSSDELLKALSESVKGFKELKVLGKQRVFFERFSNAALIYSNNSNKADFITQVPRYLVEVMMLYFIALSCLVLTLSGYEMPEVIATMSVFSFAAVRLIPSVNAISRGALSLKFGRDTTERLFSRLNKRTQAHITESFDSKHFAKIPSFQKLSIKNVSFSYDGGKSILEKVNLDIEANKIVAIVGRSGSGKSTLADIILGFLQPDHGEVFLNSKPIKEYKSSWLDIVAYLPQDTLTVDKSLRFNVSLSDEPNKSEDLKIISALRKVGLGSFLENLKSGLDTRLGENGSLLSGGQKQRISIARALFHKRQILVLDEVTSALDEQSEQEIVNELVALKTYCTIVLITHRKKLLSICDKVYSLSSK